MVSSKFLRNLLRKRNNTLYNIFMYLGTHQGDDILYQTEVAKYMKIPVSTLNGHITKIKQEGLIREKLYLSREGLRLFKFIWDHVGLKRLRAHNIQVKYNLSKCPNDFIERYSKSVIEIISNGRYKGFKSKFGSVTVMFYSRKKIMCVFSDVYADNDEEISSTIQLEVTRIKKELEQKFIGIEIKGVELAKIQTSHIAVLDSILSECISCGGEITYEGNNISVDQSHGRHEIELTNPDNNLGSIMDLLEIEEVTRNVYI